MRKTIWISVTVAVCVLVISAGLVFKTVTARAKASATGEKAGSPSACTCNCKFAKTPILTAGNTGAPNGGTRYSYEPNVATGCGGSHCTGTTTYAWTASGTATFTIGGDITNEKKINIDVTSAGDVTLTCTVTVTCSDGTKCSATGSSTFRNLKP